MKPKDGFNYASCVTLLRQLGCVELDGHWYAPRYASVWLSFYCWSSVTWQSDGGSSTQPLVLELFLPSAPGDSLRSGAVVTSAGGNWKALNVQLDGELLRYDNDEFEEDYLDRTKGGNRYSPRLQGTAIHELSDLQRVSLGVKSAARAKLRDTHTRLSLANSSCDWDGDVTNESADAVIFDPPGGKWQIGKSDRQVIHRVQVETKHFPEDAADIQELAHQAWSALATTYENAPTRSLNQHSKALFVSLEAAQAALFLRHESIKTGYVLVIEAAVRHTKGRWSFAREEIQKEARLRIDSQASALIARWEAQFADELRELNKAIFAKEMEEDQEKQERERQLSIRQELRRSEDIESGLRNPSAFTELVMKYQLLRPNETCYYQGWYGSVYVVEDIALILSDALFWNGGCYYKSSVAIPLEWVTNAWIGHKGARIGPEARPSGPALCVQLARPVVPTVAGRLYNTDALAEVPQGATKVVEVGGAWEPNASHLVEVLQALGKRNHSGASVSGTQIDMRHINEIQRREFGSRTDMTSY